MVKPSETYIEKEQSGAPKNVHRKTDSEIEQLVVSVQKSLLEGASLSTIITHHQKERPDSPKEEAIHQMQVQEAVHSVKSY